MGTVNDGYQLLTVFIKKWIGPVNYMSPAAANRSTRVERREARSTVGGGRGNRMVDREDNWGVRGNCRTYPQISAAAEREGNTGDPPCPNHPPCGHNIQGRWALEGAKLKSQHTLALS